MAITVTEKAASRGQADHHRAAGGRRRSRRRSICGCASSAAAAAASSTSSTSTRQINEKLDEVFEFHGVPVVVDKRSLMYLSDATVDFHDDLNKRGFSITQPERQEHLRLRQFVLDVMAMISGWHALTVLRRAW